MTKLSSLGLKSTTLNWIIDFLRDRQQRIKLSGHCYSDWQSVPAGVPQGTRLGPWLFLVMINDLKTPDVSTLMWKFADDSTVSEAIPPCNHSKLQPAVDHISNWSKENFLQINPSKCKEIYFTFKRIPVNHVPIEINGIQFDKVPSVKVLGLTIQNNFKWNAHVDVITSKAAKRLYLLRQLKRAGINTHDLVQFYCAVIRSVLEHACQVFHRSLPDYLSTQIEAIQRRAMRTIYPDLNYAEALEAADLVTLFARRDKLSKDLFEMIASDTDHKLASLLPLKAFDTINLRRMRDYQIPKFRTNRFKNSFIISHAIERYRS